MSIQEHIAAYDAAMKLDDRVASMAALSALVDEEVSFDEWVIVRAFCEAHGLDARLEILTRRLLAQSPSDFQPYATLARLLLRSKANSEAIAVIQGFRTQFDETQESRWESIDILRSAGANAACIEIVEDGLAVEPNNIAFRIMECLITWDLGDFRTAKRKLLMIRPILGTDPGFWLWYSDVASLFGKKREARSAVLHLIDMLSQGRAMINSQVVFALRKYGLHEKCRVLLASADPANYPDPVEQEALFDAAVDFALHDVAMRFASALERKTGDRLLALKLSSYRQHAEVIRPLYKAEN